MNTLKEILNKPYGQLTKDDRQKLYEHYRCKLVDNFDICLAYATELREFEGKRRLRRLMIIIKDMMFDVEREGIDIGNFN